MIALSVLEGWSSKRLKYIASYNDEVLSEGTDEDHEIEHVEISGVSFSRGIKEIECMPFGQAPSRARRKVRSGDILVSTVRTYLRAIATVDEASPGLIASTGFCVVRPGDEVDNGFMGWAAKSEPFVSEVVARSAGVSYPAINASELAAIEVALPPRETQKSIADFLDRETVRIDQLIEKKQRFLELTARRVHSLVDEAISDPQVPRVRFEHVVRRMQRPVILSEHEELVRLGLFNRGRGMFKKPAADEEGMGDSSFYFVREGDLILSGQFAWEGAVALATEDEECCVVSHRYPVYRGKDGTNTAYLLGLLRSGFGDFLLNESSRGSAGRNRPLNTSRLGKEKIPVPAIELQESVDLSLAFECQLKRKTEQSIGLLNESRSALITAAVTGQIDVATWGKKGQTDRHLDEIEEAMQT